MKWGNLMLDPISLEDVCIEEIKICNQTSFGPSFVVLVFLVYLKLFQLNLSFFKQKGSFKYRPSFYDKIFTENNSSKRL